MPGGFGNTHLEAGDTPCNWPSLGRALPLLLLLQLKRIGIATKAINTLVVFFIVFNFGGMGKCNEYFDLSTSGAIDYKKFS